MTDRGRVYKGETPLCGTCRQALPRPRHQHFTAGEVVKDQDGTIAVICAERTNQRFNSLPNTGPMGSSGFVRVWVWGEGEAVLWLRCQLTVVHGFLHIDPVKARVF